MNLTRELESSQFTNFSTSSINTTVVMLQWNIVESSDRYIITITPSVQTNSTFTTGNTSIQLHFLYNQEYSISVIASNCAGNSTPTHITIRIGRFVALLHICNYYNIMPWPFFMRDE